VLSLDAQAMTPHGERSLVLFACVWLALGFGAWRIALPAVKWTALVLVGVGLPLLAFGGADELFLLAAGHWAELGFAALCFWRALTGGFTSSSAERWLYSAVGWYLLAVNAWLTLGLAFSASHRRWYEGNGSFGLENDYARIASEVRGLELAHVGVLATVPALLVLPLAVGLWWLTVPDETDE
jgi:hypothetical protein